MPFRLSRAERQRVRAFFFDARTRIHKREELVVRPQRVQVAEKRTLGLRALVLPGCYEYDVR